MAKAYISPHTKYGPTKPVKGPEPKPKPVSDKDHEEDKKAAGLAKAGLPATPKAQIQQHALMAGSKAATATPAEQAPVKLPSPATHEQRAQSFHAAQAGAFQPSGPVHSGLELDLKSPKTAGVTRRPGIFGRLGGK